MIRNIERLSFSSYYWGCADLYQKYLPTPEIGHGGIPCKILVFSFQKNKYFAVGTPMAYIGGQKVLLV